MKKVIAPKILTVTLLSCIAAFGCANSTSEAGDSASTSTITENSTELEKVGYSLGYATATSYKGSLDDLNLDTFELGFRDAYGDKEAALTKEQMQEVMSQYEKRKQAEIIEKMEQDAARNKAAGDEFLAGNAKKEGVKTTDSGLQYKVLKPGTGEAVTAEGVVKLHYEGKLLDGTVFDSSYEKGEPAIVPVQGMIPGFSEGLQLMQEGGEYELYIPADLAYGETGVAQGGIEPNSTLIFKVEVIEVNPEMPQQPAQ